MKQVIKFLVMTLIIPVAGYSQTNVFPSSGNVGIGTVTPNFPLEVTTTTNASSGYHPAGSFSVEQTGPTTGDIVGVSGESIVSTTSGAVNLSFGVSGSCIVNGGGNINEIRAIGSNGGLTGSANITNWSCFWGGFTNSGTGIITNGFGLFVNPFPSNVLNKWGVFVNDTTAKNYFAGTIGVGTQDVGSFRLAVEGKIGAREVQVTNTSPWPDYVFNKTYKLMNIDSLDNYIKTNNHLPGMPSAEDVTKKDGVELGDMTTRLLKKVEELTLYVIELKKENEEIKAQLEKFSGK